MSAFLAQVSSGVAPSKGLVLDATFWALAALTLFSAGIVTFSRSIVHSGFALLGTFLGVAGLYALLAADFLAAAQVLVYVGGILVLILFAVMLTSRISALDITNESVATPVAVAVSGIVTAALLLIAWRFPWSAEPSPATGPTSSGIGDALLGAYVVPFEVVSILLLAALVGSVLIVRHAVKGGGGEK